jgi:hypothetical protein
MGDMTEPQEHQVIVVGPDGQPMGMATVDAIGSDQDDDGPPDVADMIEVRSAPLDDASRARLREIHERSIVELEQGLAPELREELHRLSLPFRDEETPTDSELRVAQAQLVGWLEGLFHGIQTALFAQQMAARVQLEEMRRRALPPGSSLPGLGGRAMMPGQPAVPGQPNEGGTGTGQYL